MKAMYLNSSYKLRLITPEWALKWVT